MARATASGTRLAQASGASTVDRIWRAETVDPGPYIPSTPIDHPRSAIRACLAQTPLPDSLRCVWATSEPRGVSYAGLFGHNPAGQERARLGFGAEVGSLHRAGAGAQQTARAATTTRNAGSGAELRGG